MARDKMKILTDEGLVWVTPVDDAQASEIGSYWNAVRHYRRTGDDSELWPFEGRRTEGRSWTTDPDSIDFWAGAGEIDFEDIYEEG